MTETRTEDDLLNDICAENISEEIQKNYSNEKCSPVNDEGFYDQPSSTSEKAFEFCQWQILSNDVFRPAGITCKKIPSGVYNFDIDNDGIFIQKVNVITDSLVELPENSSQRVLDGMKKFWNMEKKYREHGLLYKRGILLWGPPGSGKTATITLLTKYLLDSGGIVVICQNPKITSKGLEILRRIEPSRRIICIIEDIDEIISKYGEHDLLALLDGENQVDRIVMIATTNYPDRLGARIINRPSRFDERILVNMPSAAARKTYLTHIIGNKYNIDKWVIDTEGLSIAHLREMAAAICCLEQDYDVVLKRLKTMKQKVATIDGLENKTGF